MTQFLQRIGGEARPLPRSTICDAWLADGHRFGDELPGVDRESVLGRWPGELETDAVVRLAQAVGENATWEAHAGLPAVAQKLAERARPQPLDVEIARHLQHLQHVCHRPRLQLRVEEERLPVSRARRTPVRAVAELVSHPADWEHRTLRSIQPSRVLARQIEDEWNLYENRVASRLVDHLLGYLAKRLEELRKIKETLDASRNYGDEMRRTSFRRAHRIADLWSSTLESKTEEELGQTMRRLELAQRDLQALLDSPLYQRVPRRQAVALSLKPTNILVNDPHYRKVAALWRFWVKYGHKHQETNQQREDRRQREALAWDRFVLHLVVRGFAGLGWSAAPHGRSGWTLRRPGWCAVNVAVEQHGVVALRSATSLRFLPLCTTLVAAEGSALTVALAAWDGNDGEVVAVHVGGAPALADADRAAGWSFGKRAVLFGCSPWSIDSEERMARVISGWLSRAAVPPYPISAGIQQLPAFPPAWDWLRYNDNAHLVALRAPNATEASAARTWAALRAKEMEARAREASQAQRAYPVAPGLAVAAFQQFIEDVRSSFVGLDLCPACGGEGIVDPRPGKLPNGSDAGFWAICSSCKTEWGLRPCTSCESRYRAMVVPSGLDLPSVAEQTASRDWPDKVLGRDVWAKPCSAGVHGQFRCPDCGECSGRGCGRCSTRVPSQGRSGA